MATKIVNSQKEVLNVSKNIYFDFNIRKLPLLENTEPMVSIEMSFCD